MASRRAVLLAVNGFKLQPQTQSSAKLQLLSTPKAHFNTARSRSPFLTSIRQKHTIPRPPPPPSRPGPSAPLSSPKSLDNNDSSSQPTAPSSEQSTPRSPPPQYELTFTCVPCGTRSKHKVSKQGYHHGSVLIACPSCKNRHVISDHLKIFGDRRITVEDLLRERGQLVRRGTLGEDGDLEFWDDGTATVREKEEVQITEGGEGGQEKWREQAPGTSFKNNAGGQAGP